MKRLILLRHAQSEERKELRDHDRPLSEKGKDQALATASKLKGDAPRCSAGFLGTRMHHPLHSVMHMPTPPFRQGRKHLLQTPGP